MQYTETANHSFTECSHLDSDGNQFLQETKLKASLIRLKIDNEYGTSLKRNKDLRTPC